MHYGNYITTIDIWILRSTSQCKKGLCILRCDTYLMTIFERWPCPQVLGDIWENQGGGEVVIMTRCVYVINEYCPYSRPPPLPDPSDNLTKSFTIWQYNYVVRNNWFQIRYRIFPFAYIILLWARSQSGKKLLVKSKVGLNSSSHLFFFFYVHDGTHSSSSQVRDTMSYILS